MGTADGARWVVGRELGWTELTLLNGAAGNLSYAKAPDGTTFLDGQIQGTVSGVEFAELPPGSRPVAQAIVGYQSNANYKALLTYGGRLHCMASGTGVMHFGCFTFKARVEPEVEPL